MKGLIFSVQKALPLITAGGSIILTGSSTGVMGTPQFSIYSATKAAIRNLARSWALDLRGTGIRVNVLSPGPTRTELAIEVVGEEALDMLGATTPIGRMGEPAETGAVAAFLLGVSKSGRVDILVSPIAPMPRKDTRRRSRLVEEHMRRPGDPVPGGGTRKPIMIAYRQQALACAAAMASSPQRPRDLKHSFPDAQKILHRNVYGWFERSELGVYALTDTGRSALASSLPASPAYAECDGVPETGAP